MGGSQNPYSIKHVQKPVNFYHHAPQAASVCVLGDFNGWTPGVDRMEMQQDGSWHASISLAHGHHQYVFLVDGQPVLDSKAQGIARNRQGQRVSMISVS